MSFIIFFPCEHDLEVNNTCVSLMQGTCTNFETDIVCLSTVPKVSGLQKAYIHNDE